MPKVGHILFMMVVLFIASTRVGYAGDLTSATGTARMRVNQSLRIEKTRDMDFGTAVTGTAEATLNPNQGEGAEFSVKGEPNKAYSIVLPEKAVLTTESGESESQRIEISQFQSSPKLSGNLSSDGSEILRVGATRPSIGTLQQAGEYSGHFTVTLTYP